jgi:hypothetical protein
MLVTHVLEVSGWCTGSLFTVDKYELRVHVSCGVVTTLRRVPRKTGVCVVNARKSMENKTWPVLKLTALLMPGTAKCKNFSTLITLRSVSSWNNSQNSGMKFCENMKLTCLKIVIIILEHPHSMIAWYMTPDSKIYYEKVKLCRFSSENWFFCIKFVRVAVSGKRRNKIVHLQKRV